MSGCQRQKVPLKSNIKTANFGNIMDEGMGTFLSIATDGEDLGGSSVGSFYNIEWTPGQAPIEPMLDSMISRLEFMQQTTSGSTTNQKKLFELVDLKRRLSLIEEE